MMMADIWMAALPVPSKVVVCVDRACAEYTSICTVILAVPDALGVKALEFRSCKLLYSNFDMWPSSSPWFLHDLRSMGPAGQSMTTTMTNKLRRCSNLIIASAAITTKATAGSFYIDMQQSPSTLGLRGMYRAYNSYFSSKLISVILTILSFTPLLCSTHGVRETASRDSLLMSGTAHLCTYHLTSHCCSRFQNLQQVLKPAPWLRSWYVSSQTRCQTLQSLYALPSLLQCLVAVVSSS